MNNQGGMSTSDMARKVMEREPEKLRQELKDRQKELGLRDMIPKGGQDVLQQLTDIDAEKNNILETMQQEKEKRLKRTAEERKAKEKTYNEKLKIFLAQKERKAKTAFDNRRVVYQGFGEYEDTIKMLPFRVLLKEEPAKECKDGMIVLPERRDEKYPLLKVVCVGEYVDGVSKGDTVIVERFSGIEIVDGKEVYRIVYDVDILCNVEEG